MGEQEAEEEDLVIFYVQSSSLMKAEKISILVSYWCWKLVLILKSTPLLLLHILICRFL